MAPLEFWMLIQIGLEALLIVLMLVFLVSVRRRGRGGSVQTDELQSSIEHFISESEKLSETFTNNLRQKKELSLGLLLKLERKINELNRQLERAEQDLARVGTARPALPPVDDDKANPASPESRALVLKLAGQGRSVEEIARQARLHRGEVELILDLEKKFAL